MPFDISLRAAVAMLVFMAAERYPAGAASDPEEERHRFATLRTSGGLVGTSSYAGCVTVGIGARGLSVALWAPFALFHPPFFLPWSAVEGWRTVEFPGGHRAVQLTVRDGGSLAFYGRAGAGIARRAGLEGVTQGKP